MNTDSHKSEHYQIFSKIRFFFNSIKFQESVFALPFAYMGMILAEDRFPEVDVFVKKIMGIGGQQRGGRSIQKG